MAPPHTITRPQATDDLDDLFNFLDADNNDAPQNSPPAHTTTKTNTNQRQLNGDDPLGLGLGIDEEVKVRKPRAPIAKLDETRLLSDKGIPRLRRITKDRLRFKGKGYEFQDVSRLLNTYQLWLDSLYPKANFADGIAMIEKLGHKKRIQVMRKEWIDEDRPKPAVEEEDADFVVGNGGEKVEGGEVEGDVTMGDDNGEKFEGRNEANENGESQGVGQLRSSSPLMLDDEELYAEMDGSIPAAKPAGAQEPDEDELDALLAEETAIERPTIPQSATQKVPDQGDDFADDEEAMAMMGW